MTDATALTPEQLVALLAEAGDLDAGTEVLDALRVRRMREGAGEDLLPLQAKLFNARDRERAHRIEVLAPLRDGVIDELARDGLLLEAAAAWRALCRAWPDEPGWSERLGRVELLIAPLDRDGADPARAAVDDALARGDLHAAWASLSALGAMSPHDLAVSQRVDALRVVLFGPSSTQPYQQGADGDRSSLVTASVRASAEVARTSQPPQERLSSPSGELTVSRRKVLRVGEK